MTTYRLDLRMLEDHEGAAARILASLNTEEPAVMAATLRSLADRLDPPKPPPAGPVYRDRFRPEGYADERRPGSRITPDGCGPEHTYTGSCHLAAPGTTSS